MIELKSLSKEAVLAALGKAEHYRYLNEPVQAESICLDVLDIDPGNQRALVTLILALTDQFGKNLKRTFPEAKDALAKLESDYDRVYYWGLVCERRARMHLDRGGMGAGYVAYDWFHQALESYDEAAKLAPSGNEDAILRWNACARVVNRNPDVVPEPLEDRIPRLLE